MLGNEYGWDYPRIRDLTFLQQHLLLAKIVSRKQREAGDGADEEEAELDVDGLTGFMS